MAIELSVGPRYLGYASTMFSGMLVVYLSATPRTQRRPSSSIVDVSILLLSPAKAEVLELGSVYVILDLRTPSGSTEQRKVRQAGTVCYDA
jgi:hypothetical protein